MNIKKIIIIISTIIIVCQSVALSATIKQQFIAEETDYNLKIYGEEQSFELPVVNINNRTYVPLEEFVRKFDYAVNWNVDNKIINIFEDKTRVSQDGILDNGKKYHFYGTNDEKFDLPQYLRENNLMKNYERGKTFAETPQTIAEQMQRYVLKDSDISLDIHYDATMDEWVIMEILPKGSFWIDFWSIDTVNRKTGVITHHYFDFDNTTKEYNERMERLNWEATLQKIEKDREKVLK